jgi:hypothetical protein
LLFFGNESGVAERRILGGLEEQGLEHNATYFRLQIEAKRYGASRPVTTGNFSIHHRTARAVPLKVGAIGVEHSVEVRLSQPVRSLAGWPAGALNCQGDGQLLVLGLFQGVALTWVLFQLCGGMIRVSKMVRSVCPEGCPLLFGMSATMNVLLLAMQRLWNAEGKPQSPAEVFPICVVMTMLCGLLMFGEARAEDSLIWLLPLCGSAGQVLVRRRLADDLVSFGLPRHIFPGAVILSAMILLHAVLGLLVDGSGRTFARLTAVKPAVEDLSAESVVEMDCVSVRVGFPGGSAFCGRAGEQFMRCGY